MKPAAVKKACNRALVVASLIEKLTADRNKLFEEHDSLVAQLEPAIGVGTPAHGIVLESPFAKANVQFRPAAVRRLVIQVLEARPAANSEGTRKRKTSE